MLFYDRDTKTTGTAVDTGGFIMKKQLVFILDRSGSMSGLEKATISGFNETIRKHRAADTDCAVTTILFDDEIEVLHDHMDLAYVPELTEKEYFTRGCTALLDAVGSTLNGVRKGEDDLVFVVITTDGLENASREYSYQTVKQMIEKRKKDGGWEFVFLGANIDAPEVAQTLGIDRKHAATYKADEKGTRLNFNAVSATACKYFGGSGFAEDWDSEIVDYEKKNR
mgnify:CR=1 FL=1